MSTILFTFGVPDFTGASKMGFYFARAARDAGHRIVACCGPRPTGAAAGASVADALETLGATVINEDGFGQMFDRKLLSRLTWLIQREGVDCVVPMQQLDFKIAAWAARRAGVPCVASLQNFARFWGNAPKRAVKWLGYAWTLHLALDRGVCASAAVLEQHRRQFRIPSGRLELISNGIDVPPPVELSSDERLALRDSLGAAKDDLLLVNVGRLDPQKGQHVLLQALAKAQGGPRSIHIALIGGITGNNESVGEAYAASLRDAARDLKIQDRVTFAGWRNDVPSVLAAADGYVHSALWEGLPLALLEAMAARLPVIGTDCCRRPEGFVDDVHGRIVAAGLTAPLADAIRWLATLTPQTRERVGCNARELVISRYDVAAIGRRFVGIIEREIAHCQRSLDGRRSPALASAARGAQ